MGYTRRELQESVRALEETYKATRELTPAETVRQYRETVGEELANTTVAILIKRSSWDGRISRRAKAWAAQTAEDADIYTTIHMAHLDQIANEMTS